MRILIVDDEPSIVELIATACASDGHEVASCTSSLEAVSYLKAHKVDLLISDIAMPSMDGLQLVRQARRHQPFIVAIVITGYASRYSLQDVLACGASDLLFKPFRLQELRARIDLAEERRRAIQRVQARRQALGTVDGEAARAMDREIEEALKPSPDSPLARVAP